MNVTLLDESDLGTGFTQQEDSPLQQETAIPPPIRKRNNSIIPQQLLNDIGGGGRERAALATVFGVLEYSESKIFWERQSSGSGPADGLQQELYYGTNTGNSSSNKAMSIFGNDSTFTTDTSSLDSPPSTAQQQPWKPPLPHSPSPSPSSSSTFNLLPDIPTVSEFNDLLLIHDDASTLPRPTLDRSISSSTIQSTLAHSIMAGPAQMYGLDNEEEDGDHLRQVSAPLLFIGYPPAVFDLLKPDDDDRIIIWGPDPKAVSASMATTTVTSRADPLPSRSTDTSNTNTPPLLRGFSSNTTSTSVTPITSTAPRQQEGRSRLLSGKLTDGIRKTLRSNSLIHRSSTDNLKSILLLKRTFGSSKLRQQQDSISLAGSTATSTSTTSSHVAKVIEAASVEKLVEKLTITLDYEFMTDFFLTYRSFISPTQLCKLIILRFRWALENDEEDRRVVRIRTFVVMRHWLLNYFVHDFIPIRDLRVVLTTFLNALPSHPLVRSSPRDQRIVKGLKRVVRRLKKVYYSGTNNSHRVQVIAPPPPSSDQERVEEMVRANLAHGLIRRKTALVRGVDVGGKHNGNMAVQDARRAPMVVIGNVRNKPQQQQQHQQQQQDVVDSSDMSMASSAAAPRSSLMESTRLGKESDHITMTKQSYLQRMQVERKMNALSQDPHETATTASQASIASDDSLESALSPGTTEIASDEDYYDDDDDDDDDETGTLNSDNDDQDDTSSSMQPPQWKSHYQQNRLEHERRRREEEEERKRAEFFSAPINVEPTAGGEDQQQQPSLSDLYVSDSRFSLQRSTSSVSEAMAPTPPPNGIITPDKRTVAAVTDDGSNNNNDDKLKQPSQMDGDMSEVQAQALGRVDGPIRKAAIGDTSRIRRVPSKRWCQVSPDDDSNRRTPLPHSKANTEELIRQLDDNDNGNNDSNDGDGAILDPAVGLSRRLSRKSIEKRKSEKSLRDIAQSTDKVILRKSVSTPNSPHHHTIHDTIPDMPPLPGPVVASASFLRHLQHDSNRGNTFSAANDDFEAIPYDQTVSPAYTSDTPLPSTHRQGISKKFVNRVFSRSISTPSMSTAATATATATVPPLPTATTSMSSSAAPSTKILIEDEGDQLPAQPPAPAPATPSAINSTLVSRIAQELRDSQNDLDIQCDCVRCTGALTGPRACRRFSLALLTDDEKRHSLELRQRRGASIDRGTNAVMVTDNSTQPSPPPTQGRPMYLGQLNAAFSHSDSDIGLHIEEDVDDDDSFSSSSSSSSDLSANVDHQHQQQQQQQNGNISNGSLDRLTGVSTKGDGTSLHRQALSVTSIHCIDEPLDPLPSSSIPPWHHDDSLMINDDTDRTYDLSPPLPPPFPSSGSNHNNASTANNSSFILSYRSGKMAQQLCFIERDVLLGVDWEEMVHCRWTKMDAAGATTNESGTQNNSQHEDSCLSSLNDPINYTRQIRQMQLARQDGYGGIEQVIERFNTVCQWVASEIVSVQKLDLRVKVVEKFIRLAQKCRMYSNFATLVQILLGLQSPSVSRLKKTWARVSASELRLLDELSHFTSPMRNWKHIRDNMTMVADEYGMSPTEVQVEMPGTNKGGFTKRTRVKIPFGGCIPFLGIYLSDLVFNSEQPPYLEPNHAHHKIYKEQTAASQASLSPVLKQPLVNFRKYRITATVIKRVLTFQNLARRYAFDLDDALYERCLLLDPLDAETVRRLSHAIE